ncbi:LutC/YkgG family protein [Patulibacter defluvii]|uniref:LutC/YkgG family protein n=1 Tax=Patulibacter defluvii TaxID=3095358 RepID=UPI002A75961E|nr:LUD domain-containing protein [Patulibacter sp. DM4]
MSADDARATVLARIRDALGDRDPRPTDPPPAAPAPATTTGPPDPAAERQRADRFAAAVADYRAVVVRATDDEVAAALDRELERLGATRVAVADGLPERWRPTLATEPGNALAVERLTALDAVVTGARAGIARTGTIVLDHAADQGPRRLTLVPDRHLCVVRAADVVEDVADAFAVLGPQAAAADGPGITFVSGPSATSDIELQRIEGVHGPRTLVVVLVGVW